MGERSSSDSLVAIYQDALPQVYGYLLTRCRDVSVAEDLTAETFMAAVTACRQTSAPEVTVAWLIGVARHKLVDHWRRLAREQRHQGAVAADDEVMDDPWEEWIDAESAHAALAQLSVQHRTALTVRYLDGLSVPEVAAHVERSVHATETLLVRARAALRRIYRAAGSHDREAGSHDA
jgi:RNA polymerase sigma-70 factor (ECF subfamily)